MKRIIILLLPLFTISCKNNSLKNTRWRVIKFEIETKNNVKDEDSLVLTSSDPSKQQFYQTFRDTIVVFQLNGKTDDYHYRVDGNRLIYYQNGNDTNTNFIVKKTHDRLVLRSRDGRIVTLQRIYNPEK